MSPQKPPEFVVPQWDSYLHEENKNLIDTACTRKGTFNKLLVQYLTLKNDKNLYVGQIHKPRGKGRRSLNYYRPPPDSSHSA